MRKHVLTILITTYFIGVSSKWHGNENTSHVIGKKHYENNNVSIQCLFYYSLFSILKKDLYRFFNYSNKLVFFWVRRGVKIL